MLYYVSPTNISKGKHYTFPEFVSIQSYIFQFYIYILKASSNIYTVDTTFLKVEIILKNPLYMVMKS